MISRIDKFHKVSFEQFKGDWRIPLESRRIYVVFMRISVFQSVLLQALQDTIFCSKSICHSAGGNGKDPYRHPGRN